MIRYLLLTIIFSLSFAGNTLSLDKYGSAFVEKGTLNIVRKGRVIRYKKNRKRAISVFKNDLLRVGNRSYVKLSTVQQATVFMGSNAVFQVRPWRQGKEKGYLRMLFGKAFFKVTKSRKRRFSLKTAMTAVGVKGTKWEQATASNGVTDTYVKQGAVVVTPSQGFPAIIRGNQRSIVISQSRASTPIRVKAKRKIKNKKRKRVTGTMASTLESPSATSAKSSSLESEGVYIASKKINRNELKQGKLESVSISEHLKYPGKRLTKSRSAKGSNKRGSPAVAGDKSFEKDLAESENVAETVVVNVPKGDDGYMSGTNLEDILSMINDQVDDAVEYRPKQTKRIRVKIEK